MTKKKLQKILWIMFFSSIAIFLFAPHFEIYTHGFYLEGLFYIFVFSPILVALISNINIIFKLLIVFVTIFIFYFFSVERPLYIDYKLSMTLGQNSAEDELVLIDYKDRLESIDSTAESISSTVDVWLNKEIVKADLFVNAFGETPVYAEDFDYPYKVPGKELSIRINGEKFEGEKFDLTIDPEKGDEQTYVMNLSWHGGAFWNNFPEKRIVKIHWLNQATFRNLLQDTANNLLRHPSDFIMISGKRDNVNPQQFEIRNESIFDVENISVSCKLEENSLKSFTLPVTLKARSKGVFQYDGDINAWEFPWEFRMNCAAEKITIINNEWEQSAIISPNL